MRVGSDSVPESNDGFQKIRGTVRQKLDEASLQQQLNETVSDLLALTASEE